MASILVVDDRPINREFLLSLLEYAGHTVRCAGDGIEALESARESAPDLVITDILMPSMDGVEFTRYLKADANLKNIPVIFYTATYRIPEARSLGQSCGVTSVLAKPSEPQAILDVIHEALGISVDLPPPDHLPARTGSYRALATEQLCAITLHDLTGIQQQIRNAMEQDNTPSAKARQLQQLSTHLDQSLRRAQGLSMRLSALIELGMDLASQDDLHALLEMFCHASQDILSARIVALCALTESGSVLDFAVRGMTAAEADQVRANLNPTAGWFAEVLKAPMPLRFSGTEAKRISMLLPPGHPAVASIIGMPLKSSDRNLGWFYAAGKLGDTFTEEDEQIAGTLISQLLPEYENAILVDRLKRHAAILELEAEERRAALQNLQESELRFRQLAETIREVFFLIDVRASTLLYVSPAYEEVFGRSSDHLYTMPWAWLDSIHPHDYFSVLRALVRARHTGKFTFSCRISHGSDYRWIEIQSFPIAGHEGEIVRIAGIVEDITERKLQDQRIERMARIQAVLSGINSAIVRIRERGELLDEAVRIAVEHGRFAFAWIGLVQAGGSRVEFVAYRGAKPKIADQLANALMDEGLRRSGLAVSAMRNRSHVVVNDLLRHAQNSRLFRLGVEHQYHSAVALPLMPDNKPAGTIVLLAQDADFFDDQELRLLDELAGDVSFALEYIAREERLHYLAYYDSLTDLPNTTLLHERLDRILEQLRQSKAALFLIDIDRFTHLNDTLGRHVGDRLLAEFAVRLKRQLTGRGVVARIGSDTFAVAMPDLRDDTEAATILQEQVFAAFARPFDLSDRELRISARVGAAIAPDDGAESGILFKNAESALKEAKDSGARYLFYSTEINARVAEELALEQELLHAIERDEFAVVYQPKFSATSGEITGLEALLRWNSAGRGQVQPSSFIPALEASELILDVGRWVLERTLADRRRWIDRGLDPPPIAVNVSPLQLRYPDFTDMVLSILDQHGAPGGALELEVTESVIMADIESSIERLQRLADFGVTIAVDDFGTGYSSLRYLARLPVHSLKIDRSFVISMTTDADSMTLVSTIISLARAFGLVVVAEGVDSEEQAKFLRLMKCDVMQGYLFSKPLAPLAIEDLLARGKGAG